MLYSQPLLFTYFIYTNNFLISSNILLDIPDTHIPSLFLLVSSNQDPNKIRTLQLVDMLLKCLLIYRSSLCLFFFCPFQFTCWRIRSSVICPIECLRGVISYPPWSSVFPINWELDLQPSLYLGSSFLPKNYFRNGAECVFITGTQWLTVFLWC